MSGSDITTELQRAGESASAAAPKNELGPNGQHDTHEAVADAVETLMARPTRDDAGRFIAGTPAAVTTGATSEQLSGLLEPARRAIVERTITGLGVDAESVSEPLRRLVEAHAEVSLQRESVFVQIGRLNGPVTGKGKLRALLGAYLSLVDRELRLAQAIGLDRRPKAGANIAEQFAQLHRERSVAR